MADVLYDYQLAQTLSESIADSLPKAPIEYRLSVFHKYGISAREFDHSLAYYSRHAEEMKKVYARIARNTTKAAATEPPARAEGHKAATLCNFGKRAKPYSRHK